MKEFLDKMLKKTIDCFCEDLYYKISDIGAYKGYDFDEKCVHSILFGPIEDLPGLLGTDLLDHIVSYRLAHPNLTLKELMEVLFGYEDESEKALMSDPLKHLTQRSAAELLIGVSNATWVLSSLCEELGMDEDQEIFSIMSTNFSCLYYEDILES